MPWDERIIRRLRLKDLQTLLAVVDAGNIGKAASRLNYSQPAVSKALASLERIVGKRLLERGRKGVELTAYGEALLRCGTEVVNDLRKGLAPAMNDVLGGHVDMVFSNTFNVMPLLRDGKLRVLGVDSESRVPELPDSPAISETFPGYVVTTWFAIVAPPRTPMQIAEKLSGGIAEALRQPDVAKKLTDYSARAIGRSPIESGDFIKRERERWYQVIAAAGLTKPN